jgi:hypothetical protein
MPSGDLDVAQVHSGVQHRGHEGVPQHVRAGTGDAHAASLGEVSEAASGADLGGPALARITRDYGSVPPTAQGSPTAADADTSERDAQRFARLGSRLACGVLVCQDRARAPISVTRHPGFGAVRAKPAHDIENLLTFRQCQPFVDRRRMPAGGRVIDIADPAAIDEEREHRVLGKVVEPQHPPGAFDVRGRAKHRRTDAAPADLLCQRRMTPHRSSMDPADRARNGARGLASSDRARRSAVTVGADQDSRSAA